LFTAGELRARIDKLPRVRILNLPTPFEEMPRLSKTLKGPNLWIKRDDCTGLAFGGNKERKAEFVIADALKRKADVAVTTGPVQSNHARAIAAAARKLGLEIVLVLRGKKPQKYDGNLLLDHLLGADIRYVDADTSDISSVMKEIAEELEQEGHVPYVIPGGASYPVGAVAYVNAMLELVIQSQKTGLTIDYLVHATGSGGTQAGLVLANKALDLGIDVLGIHVEKDHDSSTHLADKTAEIADGVAKLLNIKVTVESKDVTVVEGYAGKGYGILSSKCLDAISSVAKIEGVLLDPVYTGKAMAGLIDMIQHRHFRKEDNVVFIHTGGTPALFPYREELV